MKKYFIWTALDQALVSGGNFLTIFLGAIFLTLSDQGHLIVLYSFYFFCLIISISLVYAPIQSVYPKLDENSNYKFTAFLYHILISLLLIMVVIAGIQGMSLSAALSISMDSVLYFIAFLFLQQMADYGRRVAYVFYNPKVAFFLSTFLYVPRIGLFMILKPSELDSVLLLLVSTSAFNAFIIILYTGVEKVRSSLSFEKNLLLQHINFSRNIFYSAPIGWSVAYSPTLVLGFFSGPVLVGVLGTLRSIVGLANFFVEMIEVSVISHLASRKHKGEERYVQKFFKSLIILFSIFWLVLLVASIELYDFGIAFIDDEFKQYRNIFLLLCVSYIVYFYARMHVLYFRVFYDTKPEFYNSKVALISTIVLFPLIYAFDIVGAASVFIIAQLLALIFTVNKFRLEVQS